MRSDRANSRSATSQNTSAPDSTWDGIAIAAINDGLKGPSPYAVGVASLSYRGCHQFSKEVLAKQQEMVRPIHAPVLEGKATCTDCHKGVGHAVP